MKHLHMLAVRSELDSEKGHIKDTDTALSLHTQSSK
uniref:Uncharacterized protein n=1 Tax=Setaria italica TaxID=4555 RepID=K4A422_SETIT